jgi:transposase InsO family protein
LCDTSTGTPRPLIPEANRRQVFAAVHGLAHPGTRATRRLLAAKFVWRGMNSDVPRWIKDCQSCTRGKVTTQPAAAVHPIAVPLRKFSRIHVDLVGPLPVAADGSTYLLTIIDRTTRWLEATPLRTMDARTCADALVSSWVSRYDVPSQITTDRGHQFTSEIWAALCARLGISHITTTAYHPQANGMVERAHRQLKDVLRARLVGGEWPLHLPWVLFGLRAAPKEDSAISSAELVFGEPLTLPGEILDKPGPSAPLQTVQSQPLPTRPLSYAQVAKSVPQQLRTAVFVYIRRGGVVPPLPPLYHGPFKVLEAGD